MASLHSPISTKPIIKPCFAFILHTKELAWQTDRVNLEKLLKQIPEATSVEVERAKERYNNRVRGILRQETGLHFKRGENDEVTQIRISVVPGLPESLKQKHLPVV